MSTPRAERPQARPDETVDPTVETPRRVDTAERGAESAIPQEDLERARNLWTEKERRSDGEPYYSCRSPDGTAYVVSRNREGVPQLYRQKPGEGFAEVPNWSAQLSSEGVSGAFIVSVQENIAKLAPASTDTAPETQSRPEWQEKSRSNDGEPYYTISAQNGTAYVVSRKRNGIPALFRRRSGESFAEVPNWSAQLASEGISREFLDSIQEKINTLAPVATEAEEQLATEEAAETQRPIQWQTKERATDGVTYYAYRAPNGTAYVVSPNSRGAPSLFRQKPGEGFVEVTNWQAQLESENTDRRLITSIQGQIDALPLPERRDVVSRADETFRRLEAITVLGGNQLDITGSATEVIDGRSVLRRNFFRTRNIVPDRMDDFIRSVESGAQMLDAYIRQRSENWQSEEWVVHFDGKECYATSSKYTGRAIATPRGIIRNTQEGQLWTVDGRRVYREEQGNDTLLRINTSSGRTAERARYTPGSGMMSREVYEGGRVARIEMYDGRSDRPNIVRSLQRQSITVPVSSGSSETAVYTLEANKVYTFGEQGPPHTDYKSETGDNVAATARGAEMQAQEQRLSEYGERLAQDLGSPEAIARYISNHISLNSSRSHRGEAPTFRWTGDGGYQDVRHPLESLFRGSGDCEDQALVAQYLLKEIGINSVVTPMSASHYECVYIEEVSTPEGPRYRYCSLDGLYGFRRSKAGPFEEPGEAMQASFSGASGGAFSARMDWNQINERRPSGRTRYEEGLASIDAQISDAQGRGESTDALTRDRRSLVDYYTRLQDAVNNGGGASILHPPNFETSMLSSGSTPGYSDVRRFDENNYWSRFIRFSGNERDWSQDARRTSPASNTGTPTRTETASRDPRIQANIARLQEAQGNPRNEWRPLNSGVAGYQYLMDDRGNLFASREPNNRAVGYQYLNVENYTWEHHHYS